MIMTQSKNQTETGDLPYAMRDKRILSKEDTFKFGCHSGLKCFTDCCGDVNIILTPADVLKLSRRLGISTTEFLSKHTLIPITKDLHIPVPILKMNEDDKRCPFLKPEGCGVYEDRPWSCRMYPLGMGIPPARAGQQPEPVYFLFEDDFCHGREEATTWTVSRWLQDQGIVKRDILDEGFRNVVSNPWFIGGRQLDPKRIEMFHMAFYDLDRFNAFVFESSFLQRFDLDEQLVEKIREDDVALLDFAAKWLRFALFGEPTLKVRKSTDKQAQDK